MPLRPALLTALATLAVLAGCTTPYRPPVFAHGAAEFPGLAKLARSSGARPVDVVLVHGMCTHAEDWADRAIDLLVGAIDGNVRPDADKSTLSAKARAEPIQRVERTVDVAGGSIRFTALIWSPLTAGLKQQLTYDNTGDPTDCAAPGECKPRRALLNGKLKDVLLNDCLADAMIYQGQSGKAMREQMVRALADTFEASESAARQKGTTPGPLVLVTESLGSKLAFDALAKLLEDPSQPAARQAAAQRAAGRVGLIFMGANQLPILSLADQTIDLAPATLRTQQTRPGDSLENLLGVLPPSRGPLADKSLEKAPRMTVVAFTDPNDLLSYRLQASRYVQTGIAIADVLVSNTPTIGGLLSRPDHAHTEYRNNTDVARVIACGRPVDPNCR